MDATPKKTDSIVNRLTRHLHLRQLWAALGTDLAILLAAVGGWCFAMEKSACEGWSPWMARSAAFAPGASLQATLKSAQYYVLDPAGNMHTFAAGEFVYALFWVMAALLGVQILGWLISWGEERNRLRRFLKPIDDIALSAERISQQGFDPSRIQSLEEAIAKVNAADTRVHVNDEALGGLEAAVNNMLKRLQQSEREQVRFVDDASHELRTPIAVIQGYVNMLDRWGKDDPQVLGESIAAIKTEAGHMQVLVEQLLFLARGDMGRQRFTPERLPLGEMLREIQEESCMIDEAHTYILDAGAPLYAMADPAMLKQAVRILVDNAAKYTPAGGEIELRLKKNDAGEACIQVQDSGVGVKSGEARHMFERFYRGEAARKQSGSGLGLSIAEWIVREHRGHIEVVSFESVGTRISICLPEA